MTHKQALQAMPSASRTLAVLLKLDVECPKCKGKGYIIFGRDEPDTEPCSVCDGTKKVKWKWEPKYDDYFVTENGLIVRIQKHFKLDRNMLVVHSNYPELYPMTYLMEEITFIPHWEDDIEPILEKAGYYLEFYKYNYAKTDPRPRNKYGVRIHKHKSYDKYCGSGDDRQQAVILAMDALGRELECGVRCQ